MNIITRNVRCKILTFTHKGYHVPFKNFTEQFAAKQFIFQKDTKDTLLKFLKMYLNSKGLLPIKKNLFETRKIS